MNENIGLIFIFSESQKNLPPNIYIYSHIMCVEMLSYQVHLFSSDINDFNGIRDEVENEQ